MTAKFNTKKLRENPADLLQIKAIYLIKSIKLITVDIQDSNNCTPACHGYHYLRARKGAARDMAWELIHIGNHNGTFLFPRGTTNTSTVSYTGACHGSLKRPQYQLIATYTVKSDPEKPERLL